MLKFTLHDQARIRFYWDGAALQAHAEAMGDPSLNWLDLPALGRACGFDAAHVWFAPTPPVDRAGREPVGAYAKALRGLGVESRAPAGPGIETECLRCGHGWREIRAASDLNLALAVLEDAVADVCDMAFVFTSVHVLRSLEGSLARLFPDKGLGRVSVGSARGRRHDVPVLTLRSTQIAAARLSLPDGARRSPLRFRQSIQPAAEEASP